MFKKKIDWRDERGFTLVGAGGFCHPVSFNLSNT